MKTIHWKNRALRQLRKIKDKQSQKNIYSAVDKLIYFPECDGVAKVKNTGFYRLKVGRWRVLFTESLEIITIEEVKKRNERTYK